ncbi:Polyprotein P3 [Portunus trituberculatus]|uniref:Polyprotein P3 n=1 Tax=Portunus trituberculatus TaxID=210409 RepID=A0A5B7GQR4_PORTR|nr:Polyprotein P3 [Portunus trituberculatus]
MTPMGHCSAGDEYTKRVDDAIQGIARKYKCVDDTLYDSNVEEAFWHTYEFLTTCAAKGIILKPEKFQFGRREVDFVGFCLGWDEYKPTDERLAAIRNFKMLDKPSISDIRSWYGFVNQLTPFFATTPIINDFRELLKKPWPHPGRVSGEDPVYKLLLAKVLAADWHQRKSQEVACLHPFYGVRQVGSQSRPGDIHIRPGVCAPRNPRPQYLNTPLRAINKFPAQLTMGRQRWGANSSTAFQGRQALGRTLREKEVQMGEGGDILMANSTPRQFPPLAPSTCVRVQNQASNEWDHTGLVMQVLPHRQYTVKLDGSGCVSLRNRRDLRPTSANAAA